MKKVFALAAAAALVSGCSIPVQREVGQINFAYQANNQGANTGYTIAIVKPELAATPQTQAATSNNPFLAYAMAQQAQETRTVNFQDRFKSAYQEQLETALNNTVEELITKKGFQTMGPYSTFDDVTYGDRKKVYLASAPKLTINIEKKVQLKDCASFYCTESGTIMITGELFLKLVEPLTQQTMLNKRINLSELKISRPYTFQVEYKPSNQDPMAALFAQIFVRPFQPKQLTDNSDKMLTEALNEFYSKAASKIDTLLSREEILSYANDIKSIKELKRF